MKRFRAMDWYHLAGRGDVASVVNDEDFEKESHHLIGTEVMIDGDVYVVKAVEAWALKTIKAGMPIGLLVEKRA